MPDEMNPEGLSPPEEVTGASQERGMPDWEKNLGALKELPEGPVQIRLLRDWLIRNGEKAGAEIPIDVFVGIAEKVQAADEKAEWKSVKPRPEAGSDRSVEIPEVEREFDPVGRLIESADQATWLKTVGVYSGGEDPGWNKEEGKMVRKLFREAHPGERLGATGSPFDSMEKVYREAQNIYFQHIARDKEGEAPISMIKGGVHPDFLTGEGGFGDEKQQLVVLRRARDAIKDEVVKVFERVRKKAVEIDDSVLEGFRKQLLSWAMRGENGESIGKRIEFLEEYTKGAYLYKEYGTDEGKWWKLLEKEFAERETRNTEQVELSNWLGAGIEVEGGLELPMLRQMEKLGLKGLEVLAGKFRQELIARAGIHNAFVAWKASCLKVDNLLVSLGKSSADRVAELKVGELNLAWLETLANSESEVGRKVSLALQHYIKIGEEAARIYERRANYAESNNLVSNEEEKRRQKEDKESKNFFSYPYAPQKVEAVRKEIADEVGEEGEKLAYRLFYLFGLAGKYNFGQHPGCAERDDLASLYRPNDAWRGLRETSTTLPGPMAVVGRKGEVKTQYFRRASFLESYPELVGDVLMKDGERMDLFEALKQGKFDQVRWTEVDVGYGAFVWRIGIAKQVVDKLVDMSPKPDSVSKEAVRGMSDLFEKTMSHIREVESVEEEERLSSRGERWEKRKKKRVKGEDDRIVQAALYNWVRGVIERHDPRNNTVALEDYWYFDSVQTVFRNLEGVLTPGNLKGLKSLFPFWIQVVWGGKIGSRRAARF